MQRIRLVAVTAGLYVTLVVLTGIWYTAGKAQSEKPALSSAIQSGDIATVQRLLTEGADPEGAGEKGPTPLAIAAAFNRLEMVQLLLDGGADVNARNGAAVFAGAYCPNPKALELMLEREADPNVSTTVDRGNGASTSGYTALMRATRLGRSENVRLLLEAGARVDAADGDGRTALHHAAAAGEVEVAAALIGAGADANAGDDGGATPLHLARTTELADALLGHGANANAATAAGWTALMSAALRGDADLVSLLLVRGAEVSAAEEGGWTPLHFAAAKGKVEIARLLLAAGADVSAGDENGLTPLAAAKGNGVAAMVRQQRSAH